MIIPGDRREWGVLRICFLSHAGFIYLDKRGTSWTNNRQCSARLQKLAHRLDAELGAI